MVSRRQNFAIVGRSLRTPGGRAGRSRSASRRPASCARVRAARMINADNPTRRSRHHRRSRRPTSPSSGSRICEQQSAKTNWRRRRRRPHHRAASSRCTTQAARAGRAGRSASRRPASCARVRAARMINAAPSSCARVRAARTRPGTALCRAAPAPPPAKADIVIIDLIIISDARLAGDVWSVFDQSFRQYWREICREWVICSPCYIRSPNRWSALRLSVSG